MKHYFFISVLLDEFDCRPPSTVADFPLKFVISRTSIALVIGISWSAEYMLQVLSGYCLLVNRLHPSQKRWWSRLARAILTFYWKFKTACLKDIYHYLQEYKKVNLSMQNTTLGERENMNTAKAGEREQLSTDAWDSKYSPTISTSHYHPKSCLPVGNAKRLK